MWLCSHRTSSHVLTLGIDFGWRGLLEDMQVNGPVRQKDSGNKGQQKAEKQRRKWI